jgi:hypothetical protein
VPPCTCDPAELCDACLGRERFAKRGMADVIGQCWAERVCRGEHQARAAWPEREGRTLAIARRKVAQLARDPRLVDELAAVCSRGAAAWWDRRPARYRGG